MTHKVYAFIGEQPYGLVDEFSSRQKAKECSTRVNRDGLKILGRMIPANTRIIVKAD